MGCVICDNRTGQPHHTIAELSHSWVTAGSEASPPGYVRVVSRRHVDKPYELADGSWGAECMLVARAVSAELRPKKMNYETHGNTIPLLRLHLYPRTEDDPFVGRPIGAARLHRRSPGDSERARRAVGAEAADLTYA